MRNGIRRLLVHGLAALTMGASFIATSTPPAPALTGDDGLIAIATENGIEVFDSAGDGSDLDVLIPRTPDDLAVQEPAWSPTGDRIAYIRWTNSGHSLWVANADGTNARQISAPGEFALDPAWSPDGRIAYVRSGSTIVISDPDGSHEVIVDPREQLGRPNVRTIGRPVWTAVGRIMVQLQEPGVMSRAPFLADGDGQHLRPLTTPAGETPAYSELSSNWQFSSTGLVAYVVFVPGDEYEFVHLATFDGRHILEGAGQAADLGPRTDAALSPSGNRAALPWPGLLHDGMTMVHVADVDLAKDNPLTGGFGFEVPGELAGMDWQPRCSITGTPGDDVLTGTRGPDLICGLGGNDEIRGLRGNDVIYAGAGDDSVSGGWGNDVIAGGPGADTLEGNRERDLINGRRDARAADTVHGGLGHNVCLHDKIDVLLAC